MNRLQTIRAESMPAALAEVRKRLGRDAVILHTRTCREGGVLGLAARRVVEVTAAPNISDLPTALRLGMVTVRKDAPRSIGDRAEGAARNMLALEEAPQIRAAARVADELAELKTLVRDLVQRRRACPPEADSPAPDLPGCLVDSYRALIENEVAAEIAARLVATVRQELSAEAVRDPRQVRRQLAAHVAAMLPQGGGIELEGACPPKRVALVGPTGVGKTTTVAKLAADFALRQNRRVGLITIDTYRIAAVDQLRTYAEIIGVPLHVVTSPEALRRVLADLADRELVLIDTVGRGQRDEVRLAELRSYLAEAAPCDVHLVLSATSSRRVLEDAVARFAVLDFSRLVFTKLDEALGFGVMLGCLEKAQARLSYVTTGQDVPKDIAVGEARRLAEAIVGQEGDGLS